MQKGTLVKIAISAFIIFAVMLSIGIGLSAQDEALDLEWRVTDLEGRLN
ncbi:MAG: hypothetical protein HWE26_09725 [Alteromonadaceae bacterium]|nr:hypothetical protein [Alteromonadaceae bacterium]